MSKDNFNHLAQGRIPWRAWMQLRHAVRPGGLHSRPKGSLGQAARCVLPPATLSRPQATVARHRLVLLCDWLEARLSKPFRIISGPEGSRLVALFDCITYSVRPHQKRIVTGKLIGGSYFITDHGFDLGRPLSSSRWLQAVLEHLQLHSQRGTDPYFDRRRARWVANWLEDTTYRFLCREAAFRKLNRETLPLALGLPNDLKGMALAARPRPVGPILDSVTFNTVWRNEAAFRQVARENPQLLPLFYARIEECPGRRLADCADPVAWLKQEVKSCGLTEAAWRYLVRHGSRLFKAAWSETGEQQAWEAAMHYLDRLLLAGLPPPPPPSIAVAWIHADSPHDGDVAMLMPPDESGMHPAVLGIALREADRRRREGTVEGFREEFLGVCRLWERMRDLPDANQLKAGWLWLLRHWRQFEAEEDAITSRVGTSWPACLVPYETGRWRVVPITSIRELFEESRAMHNCLNGFVDECLRGEVTIVSIRDRESGKRRACAGFRFDRGRAELIDLKGIANTPPGRTMETLARGILRRLDGVPPCPSPGKRQEDPFAN